MFWVSPIQNGKRGGLRCLAFFGFNPVVIEESSQSLLICGIIYTGIRKEPLRKDEADG
jgi:hypothetical protein